MIRESSRAPSLEIRALAFRVLEFGVRGKGLTVEFGVRGQGLTVGLLGSGFGVRGSGFERIGGSGSGVDGWLLGVGVCRFSGFKITMMD